MFLKKEKTLLNKILIKFFVVQINLIEIYSIIVRLYNRIIEVALSRRTLCVQRAKQKDRSTIIEKINCKNSERNSRKKNFLLSKQDLDTVLAHNIIRLQVIAEFEILQL